MKANVLNKKIAIALVAAAIIFIFVTAVHVLVPNDYGAYEKIINHTYDAVFFAVILVIFWVLTKIDLNKAENKVFLYIFGGMFLWFLGDLIWTFFIYLNIEPYVSVTDIIYYMGYGVFFAAMLSHVKLIKKTLDSRKTIAAIAVFAVLALISVFAVFIPIFSSDVSLVEKIVSLIYPVGDMLVLLFPLILVFNLKNLLSHWTFITAGLAVWSITDIIFVYCEINSIFSAWYYYLNIGYVLGILLIGLGVYFFKIMHDSEGRKNG
jgi:hypothetical protein